MTDYVADRKELTRAADALQGWFESQDIDPTDSLLIFAHLLARQAVSRMDANESPMIAVMKLKSLPDLAREAVKLEIGQVLRERVERDVHLIPDPEVRALVERLLKGVKK